VVNEVHHHLVMFPSGSFSRMVSRLQSDFQLIGYLCYLRLWLNFMILLHHVIAQTVKSGQLGATYSL